MWREKGYKELSEGQWLGLIGGHSSWWLADIFLECYRPDKFDSYKCWKIIKEHQVKKEKKPKQGKLIK